MLVAVHNEPNAAVILYELLAERDPNSFISHQAMPTWDEHERFVKSQPFYWWYLIDVGEYVGAIECTELNEIGVHILKRYQRKGYGRQALIRFLATHKPLPAIPAKRNGSWLANVAPGNTAGLAFFERMGFSTIQVTLKHD